jgi:uncharacterized protein (TIGR03546 family)
MLNIFKLLKKYHNTLSSERIRYIAVGFVLGMFLGLLPLSLNSVIIVLLVFALRNDRQTALLSTLIFGALGIVLDRLAHPLGLAVLQAGFLQGLWTYLYNLPFFPFTGFNNTIVMGNTLLGFILTVPAIFLCKILVLKYRGSQLQAKTERFLQNKLVSGIAAGFNIFNLRGLFIRKS